MIERFNFYDIYGYLIPGFVLLAVLALPTVLANGLPSDLGKLPDLSAAVITLIVAYVAGHLLQIVAARAVPSTAPRAPSDSILDASDKTLLDGIKSRLRTKIIDKFGIDVGDDASKSAERRAAFFLCRSALMISKKKTYCEQFEGMYVMMRGICAASAIGLAYDLGWILFRFLRSQPDNLSRLQPAAAVAILGIVVLAILSIREFTPARVSSEHEAAVAEVRKQKAKKKAMGEAMEKALSAGLLLIIFGCIGYLAACKIYSPSSTAHSALPLVATGALSALSALWTFGSYRAFTRYWAKSVYENFLLI